MKKVKKYASILLGSAIIAISLNLFFAKTDLIPSGTFGFAIIYNRMANMNLALTILLLNIFFFILAILFTDRKYLKRMIIPFLAVPTFVYLTEYFVSIIDLQEVDALLMTLYGGVLMGLGFRLVYKNRGLASGADVIMLIAREINPTNMNIANYVIDLLWVILTVKFYGIEASMYSLIAIIIMEVLSKRANLGISDAKVFYIITKNDKEVCDYIIDELGYELTIFDVKGGFLKKKNKVIMCAIPTRDYYKLKEGVKLINPKAFISITDSYEVINSNRSIKEVREKDN